MKMETYKDWEIEYIESYEEFVATKGEHTLKSPSLKELKKKISTFSFKREKVYYWTDDELVEAEITSKIDDSYNHYRISFMGSDYYGEPTRTNHGVKRSDLYMFNENNKEIFEKVNKLHDERKKLGEEIENLQKTLDPFEGLKE